jgi:hypothetical protein
MPARDRAQLTGLRRTDPQISSIKLATLLTRFGFEPGAHPRTRRTLAPADVLWRFDGLRPAGTPWYSADLGYRVESALYTSRASNVVTQRVWLFPRRAIHGPSSSQTRPCKFPSRPELGTWPQRLHLQCGLRRLGLVLPHGNCFWVVPWVAYRTAVSYGA